MSQHPAAISAGDVFHGRYRIERCLNAGGMGAIYECTHLTTQKRRALKVMHPQLVATSMRERFELEGRVTAQIESEHLCETFDAGVDDATGAPFMVMELLRGDDLESILYRCGPFSAEETVLLLAQAALALDKTHAAGVVHRDLKPQNLFLTTRDDGGPRLKILDFGIAKIVADMTKPLRQTAAIGSPVYMAPEQVSGDGAIGPAADLHALGHLAYTLLCGQAYWIEEQGALPTIGFLARILEGPVEPPRVRARRRSRALPEGFDAWFARATARLPGDRFARASTQIAELARALGTAPPRQLLMSPPPLAHRLPTAAPVDTAEAPKSVPLPPVPEPGAFMPADAPRVEAVRAARVPPGARALLAQVPAGNRASASPRPTRSPRIAVAVAVVVAATLGLCGLGYALVGSARRRAGAAVAGSPSAAPAPANDAAPTVEASGVAEPSTQPLRSPAPNVTPTPERPAPVTTIKPSIGTRAPQRNSHRADPSEIQ